MKVSKTDSECVPGLIIWMTFGGPVGLESLTVLYRRYRGPLLWGAGTGLEVRQLVSTSQHCLPPVHDLSYGVSGPQLACLCSELGLEQTQSFVPTAGVHERQLWLGNGVGGWES